MLKSTFKINIMESTLVKRKKILLPLSKEYNHSLLLCWKIRVGFRKSVELERIKAYTDWFFKNNLKPHFTMEEDFIFPLLGKNNNFVKKALTGHRRLTRLFEDNTDIERSLSLLEEELENHIRFEKGQLLNEIQKIGHEKELDLIMKIYSESMSFEDWGDTFWESVEQN